MMKMEKVFDGSSAKPENTEKPAEAKKSSMLVLLAPWLAQWILFPMKPTVGAGISVLLATAVFLLAGRFRITRDERTGSFAASIIGLLVLYGLISPTRAITLSYVSFGLLWLQSLRHKVPLTAWYSSAEYGGDKAFSNALFLATNRILTAAWGILYLCMAGGAILLMQSPTASFTGLITTLGPACMGIFTAWFSRWYPARIASGK